MVISLFLNISLYMNNGRGSKKRMSELLLLLSQKVIQKDMVCSGNNQMKYVEKPAGNMFSPELISHD